jgi:lipid-binding SYLF domain-containing protein
MQRDDVRAPLASFGVFERRKINMNMQRSLWLAATLMLGLGTAALADDSAKAARRKQEIDGQAKTTLDQLLKDDGDAKELYGKAVGYAVFRVTKGGFIVSGGGGNGVVVDKATGKHTYMRMGMGGVGLGIGGQRYELVVLFENKDRMEKFVAGGWDSSATAEAAAGKEGKAARATFYDGVAYYQITDKGLMAHADITGTKFWVNDELR